MKLRISERKQAKIKVALQAPSGAGKSMSALLLAKGLANGDFSKVAIIDSENGSADLYAHLGNYNVLSLKPPFSPEKYIEAIDVCLESKMEIIILDGISQCWDFLIEYGSSLPGNSFANWGKITPRQNAFINKILQSDAHFITTMRTKQDYVLNNKNGKFVPEKVGLKAVQRDGVDYEMTIVFDIDIKHYAKASKDRTGLFMDKPEFVITEGVGRKIKAWCESGKPDDKSIVKIQEEIDTCLTLEGLRHVYSKYPKYQIQIKDAVLRRKAEIENVNSQIIPSNEIIHPSKTQ